MKCWDRMKWVVGVVCGCGLWVWLVGSVCTWGLWDGLWVWLVSTVCGMVCGYGS